MRINRTRVESAKWLWQRVVLVLFFFFFQAEDGIRDVAVTGVQTCALPISCGGHTVSRNGPTRQRIPLADVLRTALERTGESKPADIKAVQGMISRTKTDRKSVV